MSLLFLSLSRLPHIIIFFFFNDTATTEIYTLSLHDALPIFEFNPTATPGSPDYGLLYTSGSDMGFSNGGGPNASNPGQTQDRKSTRLNSSHSQISYAVFCLKKKKNQIQGHRQLNGRQRMSAD